MEFKYNNELEKINKELEKEFNDIKSNFDKEYNQNLNNIKNNQIEKNINEKIELRKNNVKLYYDLLNSENKNEKINKKYEEILNDKNNLLNIINLFKKEKIEYEKLSKENILNEYIEKKKNLYIENFENIFFDENRIVKEYLDKNLIINKNYFNTYIKKIKTDIEIENKDLDNKINNILFLYLESDYNNYEIKYILNTKENENKKVTNFYNNIVKKIENNEKELVDNLNIIINKKKNGNELFNKYKKNIDNHFKKFKDSIEKKFNSLSDCLENHFESLIKLNKELRKQKEKKKKTYKKNINDNIKENGTQNNNILNEYIKLKYNFNRYCAEIEKENKNKIKDENERYANKYDNKFKNIEILYENNINQIKELKDDLNKLNLEIKKNNDSDNSDSIIVNDEEINIENPKPKNKYKINRNTIVYFKNDESKQIINYNHQNNHSSNNFFNNTNDKLNRNENNKKYFSTNKNKKNYYNYVGLINLGNTCFMNSVLQCIRHIEPIVDLIYKNSENFSKDTIIYQLNNLIKKLNSNPNNFAPIEFRNILCKYKPKYKEKKQFDSTEFLSILFNLINKEFSKVKKSNHNNKNKNNDKADIFEQFNNEKNNFFETNNSLLNRLIVGFLCNETIYSCGHDSDIDFENFNFLDLPILSKTKRELRTLDECLHNFFLDTIEEEECDICNQNIEIKNTIKLFYLPTILIINFKRVLQNRHLNFKIDYPEILDMKKYIQNTNPNFNHSCKYELRALIKHQGTAFGGHKIAVCKDYVNNYKWYEYSDGDVSEIRNKNEIFTNEAFLLFYQRLKNDCYEFGEKKTFLSKSVINYY